MISILKRTLAPVLVAMAAITWLPASGSAAVYINEGFDYPAGNLAGNTNNLSAAPWALVGSVAGGSAVAVGNVAYPGLTGTVGNHAETVAGSTINRQDRLTFAGGTQTVADGNSIFYSAVVNVTTVPTVAGNYFMLLSTATSTNLFRAKLFATQGSDTNHYKIGISHSGNAGTQQMASNDIALGTSVFVVAAYDVVTGATNNDTARLWINPTLDSASPGTVSAQSNDNGSADQTTFGSLIIRMVNLDSGLTQIDELRVGSTWGDVTSSNVKSQVSDWVLY